MIFVTVGSRNYPFDRLFKKLDELVLKGIIEDEIFAQIGTSNYKPTQFQYTEFLSQEEFLSKILESKFVISHGASGSIMKALNARKQVIAVTRLEKYGEHINDHQIQNNEAFGLNKYVVPVYEMDELEGAIISLYEGSADLLPWENKDPYSIIRMIDEFIEKNW